MKSWPHAPVRRPAARGTFFVTAGTYRKEHFFAGDVRLDYLESALLKVAAERGWDLEAWAVFPNHYHFVARQISPEERLVNLIRALHSRTASWVNRRDSAPGRTVWHNYRDTELTFNPSYLARLNYTNRNAVHHGLVRNAENYPYCSAAFLRLHADPAWLETVQTFPIDQLNIFDEY